MLWVVCKHHLCGEISVIVDQQLLVLRSTMEPCWPWRYACNCAITDMALPKCPEGQSSAGA